MAVNLSCVKYQSSIARIVLIDIFIEHILVKKNHPDNCNKYKPMTRN